MYIVRILGSKRSHSKRSHWWRIESDNGKILSHSESYKTACGCKRTATRLQKQLKHSTLVIGDE